MEQPNGAATLKAKSSVLALGAGGLAALLASACCVAPLVLVSVGLGGAWLSTLQALQPYQPIFVGLALVALFFAYRRIFRKVCAPGDICAVPAYRLAYKITFWLVAGLLLVAVVLPYIAPLFY